MKGGGSVVGHIVFFAIAIGSTIGWLKQDNPSYVVAFGLPVLFFFWLFVYHMIFGEK